VKQVPRNFERQAAGVGVDGDDYAWARGGLCAHERGLARRVARCQWDSRRWLSPTRS
jgi:hypothetical protein